MDNEQDNPAPAPEKKKQVYHTGPDHWTQRRKQQMAEQQKLAAERKAALAAQPPVPEVPPVAEVAEVATVPVTDSEAPVSDYDVYKSDIERVRSQRGPRKPFGSFAQKLAYDMRPGYKRHWFNDFPGRVDEATLSGWTNVIDKGQPVKRIVGSGRDRGALYAFLMEIPEVFWKEDMQAQFETAERAVAAIKSSPFRAERGTAKPQDDQKFYSPRENVLDIQRK